MLIAARWVSGGQRRATLSPRGHDDAVNDATKSHRRDVTVVHDVARRLVEHDCTSDFILHHLAGRDAAVVVFPWRVFVPFYTLFVSNITEKWSQLSSRS